MMDKVEVGEYYAANLGLVHAVARKCYRRLQGIGAALPYDDLVQELTMVFLRAYELHDPEKSKFSTYFTYAAYNKANRIAEGYETERVLFPTRSVEEIDDRADNEAIIFEVACERSTPEEAYTLKRTATDIVSKLSPLALLIVEWLVRPPTFVLAELRKTLAHSEHAKALGFNRRSSARLNVAFVCEIMLLISDLTKTEVNAARRELRAVESSL